MVLRIVCALVLCSFILRYLYLVAALGGTGVKCKLILIIFSAALIAVLAGALVPFWLLILLG